MRLVVDDTFNRIQKLILSRTVELYIKFSSNPNHNTVDIF